MKRAREIFFAIGAGALGYFLGASGGEERAGSGEDTTQHPATGSSKRFAEQPAKDEALAPVLGALFARGDLRSLAQIGAMLDSLDSEQMAALLEKLDRLPGTERETLLPRMLAYWTKRDPQAATAWMEPRLARFAKDPQVINPTAHFARNLIEAWAQNAPELALEYARQHPWSTLTKHLLDTAIAAWPNKDYSHRFAVLQTFPVGKERAEVTVSFFFVWAQVNQDAALAAAASLPPGPERDDSLREILTQRARNKPADALAKTRELGLADPATLAAIVARAAEFDPSGTSRWMEAQDDSLLQQIGKLVVKSWAKIDPSSAFSWASAHGLSPLDGPLRGIQEGKGVATYDLYDSPFTVAMREKPDAVLAWIRGLPAGDERERCLQLAFRHGVDPAKAPSLLAGLSPEAAARAAARIAAGFSQDIEKARQWIDGLPAGAMRQQAWAAIGAGRSEPVPLAPGPDRDAMLSGMANTWANTQPAKALDHVLEISDPALRRRTFDDVFWQLHRGQIEVGNGVILGGASETSVQAAHEWLEKANVPEEWKRAWR